ncbi:kinesin, putative [Bodo saltans]|uniref:Kinesin, putative n=1 Tax=Bodo saltans TaxID=75058 RepID=A0A0S4JGC8_BODSA|nr:kinesin, putative [Bodo saltans]|eukprot:CUG89230.1 kinesin, putative [Bodo saltans]
MDSQVKVLVRFRPVIEGETPSNVQYQVDDARMRLRVNRVTEKLSMKGQLSDSQEYNFHRILMSTDESDEVYMSVRDHLLEGFVKLGVASLVMYGQTGSGKTYTMTSISQKAIRDVFRVVDQHFVNASVEVGVAQVYIDVAYDLLTATSRNPRGLPLDKALRTIPTLKVDSPDEAIAMMIHAESHRAKASHSLNKFSSRSHSISLLRVKHLRGEAKVFLVDLAGSERVEKTKATGETFREGNAVNQSLLALSRCVQAMSTSSDYVPVRESTLTLFLGECFTAGSALSLMCTLSPSLISENETRNTLNFADVAKKVRLLRQNVKPQADSRPGIAALEESLRLMENRHNEVLNDLSVEKNALSREVRHLRDQLEALRRKHNEREDLWREDVRFLEEQVSVSNTLEDEYKRKGEELARDLVAKTSSNGETKETIERLVMENVELRQSLDCARDEITSLLMERQMHLSRIEHMWNEIVVLSSAAPSFPEGIASAPRQSEVLPVHGPTASASTSNEPTTSDTRSNKLLQLITERAENDKAELRGTITKLEEQVSQFLGLGATPRFDRPSARRVAKSNSISQTIVSINDLDDLQVRHDELRAQVLKLELSLAAQPSADTIEFDAYMGMFQTVAQLRLENEELRQSLSYAVRETDLALARHQQLLGAIRSRKQSENKKYEEHNSKGDEQSFEIVSSLRELRDQLSARRNPIYSDLERLHDSMRSQLVNEEALSRASSKASFYSQQLVLQNRCFRQQLAEYEGVDRAHTYRASRLQYTIDSLLGADVAERLLHIQETQGVDDPVNYLLEANDKLEDELCAKGVCNDALVQSSLELLESLEATRRQIVEFEHVTSIKLLPNPTLELNQEFPWNSTINTPAQLSARELYVNERLSASPSVQSLDHEQSQPSGKKPFTLLLRQLEVTRAENAQLQRENSRIIAQNEELKSSQSTERAAVRPALPSDQDRVIEMLRDRIEAMSTDAPPQSSARSSDPTTDREAFTMLLRQLESTRAENIALENEVAGMTSKHAEQQSVIEKLRNRLEAKPSRVAVATVNSRERSSGAAPTDDRDRVIEMLRDRVEAMSTDAPPQSSARSSDPTTDREAFTMLLRQLESTRAENIALAQENGRLAKSVPQKDLYSSHRLESESRLSPVYLQPDFDQRPLSGRIMFCRERNDFVPHRLDCSSAIQFYEDGELDNQTEGIIINEENLLRCQIEVEYQAWLWSWHREFFNELYNHKLDELRLREQKLARKEVAFSYRLERLGADQIALSRPTRQQTHREPSLTIIQEELVNRELLIFNQSETLSSDIVLPFFARLTRLLAQKVRNLDQKEQVANYHIDRLCGHTHVASWEQLQAKANEVQNLNYFIKSATDSVDQIQDKLNKTETAMATLIASLQALLPPNHELQSPEQIVSALSQYVDHSKSGNSETAAGTDSNAMFQRILQQLEATRAENFELQREVEDLRSRAPVMVAVGGRERMDQAGAPEEQERDALPVADAINEQPAEAGSMAGAPFDADRAEAVLRQNAVLQRDLELAHSRLVSLEGVQAVNADLRAKLEGHGDSTKENALRELNNRLLADIKRLKGHGSTAAYDDSEGPTTADLLFRQLEAERTESIALQSELAREQDDTRELRAVNEQLRRKLEQGASELRSHDEGPSIPTESGEAAAGTDSNAMFQRILQQLEATRAENFELQREVEDLRSRAPVMVAVGGRERMDQAGAPEEQERDALPVADAINEQPAEAGSMAGAPFDADRAEAVLRQNAVLQRDLDVAYESLKDYSALIEVNEQLRRHVTLLTTQVTESAASAKAAEASAGQHRGRVAVLDERLTVSESRVKVLEDALIAAETERLELRRADHDKLLNETISRVDGLSRENAELMVVIERNQATNLQVTERLHRAEAALVAQEGMYLELLASSSPEVVERLNSTNDQLQIRCHKAEAECKSLAMALSERDNIVHGNGARTVQSLQELVRRLQDELIQAREEQLYAARPKLPSAVDVTSNDHAGLMETQLELQDNIETLKLQNYEILQELNDPSIKYDLHRALDQTRRINMRLIRKIKKLDPSFTTTDEITSADAATTTDISVSKLEATIVDLEANIKIMRERDESLMNNVRALETENRNLQAELAERDSRLQGASAATQQVRSDMRSEMLGEDIKKLKVFRNQISELETLRHELDEARQQNQKYADVEASLLEREQRVREISATNELLKVRCIALEGSVAAATNKSQVMEDQRMQEQRESANRIAELEQEVSTWKREHNVSVERASTMTKRLDALTSVEAHSLQLEAALGEANNIISELSLARDQQSHRSQSSARAPSEIFSETVLDSNAARVAKMELDVSHLTRENSNLSESLRKSNADASELAHQLSTLRQQLRVLNENGSASSETSAIQTSELNNLRERERELRQALIDAQADTRRAAHDCNSLRNELADARVFRDELQHQLDLHNQRPLQTQNTSIAEVSDVAVSWMSSLLADTFELREELLQITKNLHATSARQSSEALQSSRRTTSDANREKLKAAADLFNSQMECNKLKSQNAELLAQLNEVSKASHDTIAQNDTREHEIAALQATVSARSSEVAHAREALSTIEDERRSLRGSLALKAQEISALTAKIQQSETNARALEEALSIKSAEVLALQAKIDVEPDVYPDAEKSGEVARLTRRIEEHESTRRSLELALSEGSESANQKIEILRKDLDTATKKNKALGVALKNEKGRIEASQFQLEKMTKLYFENRKQVHDQAIILQRNQQKMAQMQLMLHSAGAGDVSNDAT